MIESRVVEGDLLWSPSSDRITNAGVTAFRLWINRRCDLALQDYQALWQWSVEDVELFWRMASEYFGVFDTEQLRLIDEGEVEVLSRGPMYEKRWFNGLKVNLAHYLLKQGELGPLTRTAVFGESEVFEPQEINWSQLRQQVMQLATYLREQGVVPGDRVVAYIPASIESIVAVLACMSVGAVWSSCSPDFGSKSVLERFSQIEPKLMITVSSYRYNGKAHDRQGEVEEIIAALPSLDSVIHLPWLDHANPASLDVTVPCISWRDALERSSGPDGFDFETFEFSSVEFNHPLWIMYTSGTTGMPKGIVHSQGGVLLELAKFAWCHDDLTPDSIKFFFTTAGWAMFNMLLGGLASGSAVVLYDGCPTYPNDDRLWSMSERLGITYFGVSPTYIHSLMNRGYSPKAHFTLDKIKTVASGGSPVSAEVFRWFYDNIHQDLHVVSMSGGTDVATAFVGGVSTLPVTAGRIQAPCLGVAAFGFSDGADVVIDEPAELVITKAMPSMPIMFWNDSDSTRYFESYFDHFENVWRQGDRVQFSQDLSCHISGRSDSTLNRSGIRIGTAEIYRNVESIDGVNDSLIVNLELSQGRSYMPLFVVLEDGGSLNAHLLSQIRCVLSQHCSPRHVPDEVYNIPQVPYTLTGKKQEIPIKKLLSGQASENSLNRGACANPEALDYFVDLAKRLKVQLA